ncbi:hypothetical protein K8I61_04595 [bacterium]|nr:hypothetical protein [bacterium]
MRGTLAAALVLALAAPLGAQDGGALLLAGDEMYRARSGDLSAATRAISEWRRASEILDDPFPALIRIARAHHFLFQFQKAGAAANLSAGLDTARKALAMKPGASDANFWYGLLLFETHIRGDATTAMKVMDEVKRHLAAAHESDKNYEFAGPDRVLGRLYLESPIVDLPLAETHLASAVKLAPTYSANRLLYARVLARRGRAAEARAQLDALATLTAAPGFERELARDREAAGTIALPASP